MGVMSELHDDLSQIHAILLGQRCVAQRVVNRGDNSQRFKDAMAAAEAQVRIEIIDDLLLEIEAAGVVWPDNIVEIHHA